MSFFGSLLAGAAGGLGQGLQQKDLLDRQEAARQEALEEKRQLALQLAQQRSEDKASQLAMQKEIAGMRFGGGGTGSGSGGGGSGGGGGGNSSVIDRIMFAKTPEEQADAIRYMQATGGDEAAANLAQRYGRPMTQQVEEFDPAAAEQLSRRDFAVANPDVDTVKTVDRNVKVTQAGVTALNRVIAMADPAKYDDFIKGERGATLLDEAGKAGATIKDPVERATAVQSLSNPTTTQAAVDAKEYAADQKLKGDMTRAGATVSAAGLRASKADLKGASPAKISSILNSANSTIKTLNDSSKGSTPEAKKAWADRMAAAVELQSAAIAAQNGSLPGGAPAPAAAEAPKKFPGFSAKPVGK